MTKKTVVGAAVLVLIGLVPMAAHATCRKGQAEIARVTVNVLPGSSTTEGSATIYLRHPASMSAASFFATTTNLNVITAALNAAHTRTKVTIVGDAAACPEPDITGIVSIGNVKSFVTD